MAAPKIFISSTYYDLKQERSNIADFIKSLGYEPVMHERAGVTYTQTETLEKDCYIEIQNCDILVCIIGNHFGSQSEGNDYSITMNELIAAKKDRKKIFTFILNNVYVENDTYLKNKGNSNFTPAYADNLKIHEFISDIRQNFNKSPIIPFTSTADIIENLKLQFAGMFQRLLAQEATLTNSKTMYDLQETADNMKTILADFVNQQELMVQKFNSAVFANKMPFQIIRTHLGLNRAFLIIDDLDTFDEFMELIGFVQDKSDLVYKRSYFKNNGNVQQILNLSDELFDENNSFKDIRNKLLLNEYILWEEKAIKTFDDDSDIPF